MILTLQMWPRLGRRLSPAAAAAPVAEAAAAETGAVTMLTDVILASKAGLSVQNAILLKPHVLAAKAGVQML